ncbi:MAG: trimethylamine methyltransferase family protein [Spirochaetaceae bacterium]|nr:MAG: trimethylamine methyltransferase family protein [Spirochaetaceae bacterium]
MNPTLLEVLSEEDLRLLDRASKEILFEVGIGIRSREILQILEDRGLIVDQDRSTVKFEESTVVAALSQVPESIELYDRDKNRSFVLGRGNPPRFASGFNAVFHLPGGSTDRQPATKKQVADYAGLSNQLEFIDVVGPQALPQDVPQSSAILHALDAVLNSTVKPVLFAPENDHEMSSIIEILRIVTGGNNLNETPIGLCQFSPSSPLFWNEGTIRGFMMVAEQGLPCTILPGPLAGATSPYTLASTLVQRNCEVLSAVVIAQLLRPGAPLLCYNGGGQFDMQSSAAVLSSPEVALMIMAGNQLARYYHLPTHACIPSSDSHCLDEQVGMENMMLMLTGVFSETDLLVNAGMFATGQTAALEQLLVDHEMIRMVKRIMEGIRVDKDHLCLDAMKRVGPMGNFLDDESTLEYLRSGEWWSYDLISRQTYESWCSRGRKTMVDRATQRLGESQTESISMLVEEKQKRIAEIIREHELKYRS